MARCDITPISAFQSTNLSSKITSFDRLSDRILRSLGYPYINVEVHRDQLYENISIASEMFAKFAGYTREYMVFNSDMYVKDYGMKLDALFTAKVSDTFAQQIQNKNANPQYSKYINNDSNVFIATSSIPGTYFSSMSSISATLIGGTSANQVIDSTIYNYITNQNAALKQYFTQSVQTSITLLGDAVQNTGVGFLNSFDYDVMDYRKVIAVVDFEEGSTTGINTLFTIEQTLRNG